MKMRVWQTQYLFSGQSAVDVQQNVCLAGGSVSDKMFFQVGWNTGLLKGVIYSTPSPYHLSIDISALSL